MFHCASAQYTPPSGEISVTLRPLPSAHGAGSAHIQISVEDTGIGQRQQHATRSTPQQWRSSGQENGDAHCMSLARTHSSMHMLSCLSPAAASASAQACRPKFSLASGSHSTRSDLHSSSPVCGMREVASSRPLAHCVVLTALCATASVTRLTRVTRAPASACRW